MAHTWSCLHPQSVFMAHSPERQAAWRSKHLPNRDEDDDAAGWDTDDDMGNWHKSGPVPERDTDVEVLSRSLQRMESLTHLALLNNAVHEEPYSFWDDGEDDPNRTLEVPSSEPLQSCIVMQHLPIGCSCN